MSGTNQPKQTDASPTGVSPTGRCSVPLPNLGQTAGWDWHEVALGSGEHPEHGEACGGGVVVLDGGQLVPSHLEHRTAWSAMRRIVRLV